MAGEFKDVVNSVRQKILSKIENNNYGVNTMTKPIHPLALFRLAILGVHKSGIRNRMAILFGIARKQLSVGTIFGENSALMD